MTFFSATLKAEIKQEKGTGAARAVRRQKKVPAIIYGKDKKQVMISLDAREFMLEYQKGRFKSRIVQIDAGSQKFNVLPQAIQFHPVKDTALHADFIHVDAKTIVKVPVPVVFVNQDKSPGIKRGGVLNAVRRAIDVFCAADNIPEKLVADVGPLQIGGNIKWSNLGAPEGVDPVISDRDFTIATIAGRMAEEEKVEVAAAPVVAAPAAAKKPSGGDAKNKGGRGT